MVACGLSLLACVLWTLGWDKLVSFSQNLYNFYFVIRAILRGGKFKPTISVTVETALTKFGQESSL